MIGLGSDNYIIGQSFALAKLEGWRGGLPKLVLTFFLIEKVVQIACRRGEPTCPNWFWHFLCNRNYGASFTNRQYNLSTWNVLYSTLYFVLIIALYWSVRLVYQLAIKPFRGWDPECRDTSLPEHLLLPAEEGMRIYLSWYLDLSEFIHRCYKKKYMDFSELLHRFVKVDVRGHFIAVYWTKQHGDLL